MYHIGLDFTFNIDDWTFLELKNFVQEFKGKHQPSKKDDESNKFGFYDEVMNQQETADFKLSPILNLPQVTNLEEDNIGSPRSADNMAD